MLRATLSYWYADVYGHHTVTATVTAQTMEGLKKRIVEFGNTTRRYPDGSNGVHDLKLVGIEEFESINNHGFEVKQDKYNANRLSNYYIKETPGC